MGSFEDMDARIHRATVAVRFAWYFCLIFTVVAGALFVGALFGTDFGSQAVGNIIGQSDNVGGAKLFGGMVAIGAVLLIWMSLLLRWFGRS